MLLTNPADSLVTLADALPGGCVQLSTIAMPAMSDSSTVHLTAAGSRAATAPTPPPTAGERSPPPGAPYPVCEVR